MLLRELFEAPETVGIIFGRFNPPHQGHKAAWQEAAKNTHWYVGTNQSTIGPKDPLPFDIKIQAMETVWPEIKGHIIPEQTWWSLAAAVYKKHGKTNLRIITDETDAKVFVPGLQKQNGVEGRHGFYDFASIEWQPAPRVSSATALRAAVANNDPEAFAKAAGVPADTKVAGQPFFELVKYYLDQQQKESVDEKLDKRSLSGDTKSFRYTSGGGRLPRDNTASAKDITKKAKQADMPDGSYEIDFDNLDKEKLKKVVAKLIPTLGHEKNEMVLRARFGLEPFEREYTLKQIADAMGVTPEVIRQREAKALRQLKHISRSRELRPFLPEKIDQQSLDKFHTELDKLVHRYLGHSSDEEKQKKKIKESYKLQLERDRNVLVSNIVDNATGKRTEVRGKPGYETDGYDANDPLHKLLDVVGKSANISELMNGEEMLKIFRGMHHDVGMNKDMDHFILSHDWELRDFTPDMFPSEEEFFDYDDPFDRVIDIDYSNRIDLSQPIIVGPKFSDGKYSVIDGNHRAAAAQRMGKTIKGYFPVEKTNENFADGKKPGRKGLAKRVGVNTKASVSSLRKTAKNSSGEKQRMAHWLANMKAGRQKAKKN